MLIRLPVSFGKEGTRLMYVMTSPYPSKRRLYLLTEFGDISKLPRCGIPGTQGTNVTDDEPCSYGSKAILCTGTDTTEYILTPDNNWTKKVFDSGTNEYARTTYVSGGSVAFTDLPLAEEVTAGMVYNITDAFVTTADFIEGAGISCPAGTDVIIAKVRNGDGVGYKYALKIEFLSFG